MTSLFSVAFGQPARRHLAVFLLGMAPLAVMAAAPASLEDRVRALETQLAQIAGENAVLKKQLGLDGKTPSAIVTAAGKETKLSIGGYLQGQAEFGDAPDARFAPGDRFYLRRARVVVKGGFAEHFGFTLQSDLGSNSVGAVSSNRAQATDAFIIWNRYDTATLTFGQFKTPYGYEQLLPDTKLIAIERSLPNDQLTLSRQLGAMLSGAIAGKRLTYAAGLFNGTGINTSVNDNDQFLYVGRVTGIAIQSETARLAFGGAAFTTRDTGTFTGHRTGTQLDAQFTIRRAGFYAEYFRTHYDRLAGTDTNAHGWALLGTYFVVPKTLQAIARYETFDPNRAARSDNSDLWTLGFNYLIKGDDLMLSLNYLLGDPANVRTHQNRLTTRMQVVF
jgi:phosphate-selective porin OprO and OprP